MASAKQIIKELTEQNKKLDDQLSESLRINKEVLDAYTGLIERWDKVVESQHETMQVINTN